MTERIKILTEKTLGGEMYVKPVSVSFEKREGEEAEDRRVRTLCEYILAQEPKINEHIAFTGRFNFDGSVIGDIFKRSGHAHTSEALDKYYLKPQENLSTMEWQHGTGDYRILLEKGLDGIVALLHLPALTFEDERANYAARLVEVCGTMRKWCQICSRRVRAFAKGVSDEDSVKRLTRLADSLIHISKYAPRNFYEAVLAIFVFFSADPDSVGPLDRYLSPFYFADIKNKALTRDEAKEYLQELFLMLQASTPIDSVHFTRGGESHFCIGGYLPDGKDGFNELSALIAESVVELPTYIPQLTMRWTGKTPHEAFRFMMELERRDPHKRIAFTNDDKRIKCYTELCSIPYERAVTYTTVGCNEPVFVGSIAGSNSKGNILRCVEILFHERQDEVRGARTFDELYRLFERELTADVEKIFEYDNMYNLERAKDVNYISSILSGEAMINGKSLTQGGASYAIASPMLIGVTNVIDSLIAVKQLVFDEGLITMDELVCALSANWQGYERIRTLILNKTSFFGNDDERSNEIARRFYYSLYKIYKGKKNVFGYPWLVGDLLGYNEHHRWFGDGTRATPDGRHNGDMLKFGIGQSQGKDKEGLSALLNSISTADKLGIGCGSTVTNVSLDKSLVENDESFEKLVLMLEEYFKAGGVHFQLTYVSAQDLINAQKSPEEYRSLRVRVTGFSDYFVKLKPSIQNDIIERTVKKG